MSTAALLQELSAALTDSQRAFADAVDHVEDPALKERLMRCGNRRAPLIEELANELARMHEDVPMDGTFKAEVQRAWNSITGSFTNNGAIGVLKECARHERELMEMYDRAIAAPELPSHVRETLQQHRAMLSEGSNELITLEKTSSK